MAQVSILLFDLSGVLIELGGVPDFVRWTGRSPGDIGLQWLKSKAARDFESGKVQFQEFYEAFVREWNIDVTANQVSDSFELAVRKAFPGAHDLLGKLRTRYTLACLTNTNPIQWPIVQRAISVESNFKHIFASHQIGKVKPDVEVFEYVLDKLAVPANEVLFLDDSQVNVIAAKKVGLRAHHVKGIAEAREVLASEGCL